MSCFSCCQAQLYGYGVLLHLIQHVYVFRAQGGLSTAPQFAIFIHSFDIFEILIRCQALHEARGMRQAWVRQNACSQQPYSLGKTTGLVPGAGTYWSEREQRVMIKKLGNALRVWLAVCDECDQSKSIHDQHVSDTNYPWHFWSEPVLKCNRA